VVVINFDGNFSFRKENLEGKENLEKIPFKVYNSYENFSLSTCFGKASIRLKRVEICSLIAIIPFTIPTRLINSALQQLSEKFANFFNS
jgi:hypothetical protein